MSQSRLGGIEQTRELKAEMVVEPREWNANGHSPREGLLPLSGIHDLDGCLTELPRTVSRCRCLPLSPPTTILTHGTRQWHCLRPDSFDWTPGPSRAPR